MTAKEFNPQETTVEEIHSIICDTAVEIAKDLIDQDSRIPKKWRGNVFRNGVPYNEGRLVLEITEEYRSATDKTKSRYRMHGSRAVQMAIMRNQQIFAGMIMGEARAGRNYFDSWSQTPSKLFD